MTDTETTIDVLPPALAALKEAARAARRAKQKAEEDARQSEAAARRKALIEAAALDLGPDLWPFTTFVVNERSTQVDVLIRLPDSRPLFARFRFEPAAITWYRVHFSRTDKNMHLGAWMIHALDDDPDFTDDLGEALLLAEKVAEDPERDEIPF